MESSRNRASNAWIQLNKGNHNITNNNNGNNPSESISKEAARCKVDARLFAEFEQSGEKGKSFDYSQSVLNETQNVPEQEITTYLSKIQRGGLIQPFGCMITVEETNFRVIAYSENAQEILGSDPHAVPTLEGSYEF